MIYENCSMAEYRVYFEFTFFLILRKVLIFMLPENE
jgi:hypothetical protein